jgi:hypothetical protein
MILELLWRFGSEWRNRSVAKLRHRNFSRLIQATRPRIQQLRKFMPEALAHYQSSNARVELLPAAESLDTPAPKRERELLKRIPAINHLVAQQNGERPLVEALTRELRLSPEAIFQERQRLRMGYRQYAAARGISLLGRGSISNIVADYQRGRPWTEMIQSHGTGINDLALWIGNVMRATNNVAR